MLDYTVCPRVQFSTYISKRLQRYNVKLQQSQPQDPWNEPLTPVLVGFFRKQLDGEESASSSLRREAANRGLPLGAGADPRPQKRVVSLFLGVEHSSVPLRRDGFEALSLQGLLCGS